MRNIALTIEYDRLDTNGWQKQKDKPNIQGLIENAIEKITNEKIELIASGRTDSNVHALGQVANFKTNSNIPINNFVMAINSNLRKSIRIVCAKEVPLEFNARKSAKKKTYKYIINNGEYESAIYRDLEVFVKEKLDIEKMNIAANYLIGTHDFSAFKSAGGSVKTTIRTIYDVRFEKIGDKIIFYITGNGFLYNMVRIIVGTLIDVGTNKIEPEEFKQILENKKRENAGKTAPACGLYLVNVEYD